MEQKSRKSHQMLGGGWRLATLALALLITMGMASTVARAQGDPTDTAFDSALVGPRGERDAAGDPLDAIADREQIMADALGITVEELQAAQEAGTRLEELIDELGLDHETVHQTVQDATEAAVEQAVADGLITEDEAEAILTRPHRSGGERRRAPGGSEGDPIMRADDDAGTESAPAYGEATDQPGRPGPGGPPDGPMPPVEDGDTSAEAASADAETDELPGRLGPGGPGGGPRGGGR